MRCALQFVILLIVALTTAVAADPALKELREKPRIEPRDALSFLEEAVLKTPQRAESWIELLRALEDDKASDFTLRCYAEAALKLNPDSLALHWEWLRILPTAPALDLFASLEEREPNRQLVEDMRSVLQHGLKPPRSWRDPAFYEEWASRLVYRADWEPAAEIIARGLTLNPRSEALRTMEVMLLIGQKKYAAAIEATRKNNYRQKESRLIHTDYPRVGDMFLLHKQPKLAVESFGPEPAREVLQSREGLILGQALLLAGEVDYAERVIEQTEEVGANLLVIANLLDLKKEGDARAVADEWIKSWPGRRKEARICNNSALLCQGLYPISVQVHLRKAVAWLYQTYPQRHELLKTELPEPKETLPYDWPQKSALADSATNWIVREKQELDKLLKLSPKDLNIKEVSEVIRMLFNQYYPLQISGKYREAAEVMRLQTEYVPYHPEVPPSFSIHFAARRQESLRRDDALKFYRERPEELFQARRALSMLRHIPGNRPKESDEVTKNGEQAVAEISRLSPHSLALVYEKLDPGTKNGPDRTPYVQMIAAHGELLDSSALLELLRIVNTYQQRNSPWGDRGALDKDHVSTVVAINAALTKLSGGKPVPPEQNDPFAYWESWWQENRQRFVSKTE